MKSGVIGRVTDSAQGIAAEVAHHGDGKFIVTYLDTDAREQLSTQDIVDDIEEAKRLVMAFIDGDPT